MLNKSITKIEISLYLKVGDSKNNTKVKTCQVVELISYRSLDRENFYG